MLKKKEIVSIDLVDAFRALCHHKGKHYKVNSDFEWRDCMDCQLCKIMRVIPAHVKRDLCWWIWHNGVLDKSAGKKLETQC